MHGPNAGLQCTTFRKLLPHLTRHEGELFCLVNDLERPVGTYLYGRRMTTHTVPGQSAFVRELTGI